MQRMRKTKAQKSGKKERSVNRAVPALSGPGGRSITCSVLSQGIGQPPRRWPLKRPPAPPLVGLIAVALRCRLGLPIPPSATISGGAAAPPTLAQPAVQGHAQRSEHVPRLPPTCATASAFLYPRHETMFCLLDPVPRLPLVSRGVRSARRGRLCDLTKEKGPSRSFDPARPFPALVRRPSASEQGSTSNMGACWSQV